MYDSCLMVQRLLILVITIVYAFDLITLISFLFESTVNASHFLYNYSQEVMEYE